MNSRQHTYLKNKLAQYQNDELSQKEREIIDQWFNEHLPTAKSEFSKDEKATAQLRLELLGRIQMNLATQDQKELYPIHQDKKTYRFPHRWLSIACSVLLVAGLAYVYQYTTADQHQAVPATGQTFRTANGKMQKIILKDGTEIWMNAGTTIRIASGFSSSKFRKVYLEQGEAFFKVKRDTLRPFSITTKNLLTTVLGTSFNIRAYPDAHIYQVAVSTGKVKVARKDSSQWNVLSKGLVKGEVLTYHTHSHKTVIEPRNTALISNWKTNRSIYADGLTMSQIGAEISRQYAIAVQVRTEGNTDRRYYLTLPHQDLKIVLQQLAAAAGISYQLTSSQLIINPAIQ